MTIGVATMAENGMLVLAADRMLTRGVAQAEHSPKIYNWTDGHPVTVLWAGSAAVFGEVIQMYLDRAKLMRQPASVNDVVNLYCQCFADYVSARAEREVLSRVGLSRADLVSSRVGDRRADHLLDLMFGYCLDDNECVETIFAGHDGADAHIWRTYNSNSVCCDVEGFAAIGTGAENAIAHLSFGGYTRRSSVFAAIIAAFFAKRRAETAQGVGRSIDVCIRTPNDQKFFAVPNPSPFVTALDNAYDSYAASEQKALGDAISSATAAMQQQLADNKSAPPPTAPADLGTQALQPPEASTPESSPPPPSPA